MLYNESTDTAVFVELTRSEYLMCKLGTGQSALRASLNGSDFVKSPIIGLRGGPILGKLGTEWIRADLKFSIFGLDEVGKASYAFRADCS